MLSPVSYDSQQKLIPDPPGPHLPGSNIVARPLVPVTLALMAGVAAPAWGLHLPSIWLLGGALALWGALVLLWLQRRPARLLPLIFFALLGVAFSQQAWQPDFPAGNLNHLPENQN